MTGKKRTGKQGDILFLCQYFYPEHNSSATLPFDTARFFAGQGYKVGVLCGYPGEYYEGSEVPCEEEYEGIQIKRLPYIQSKRSGKAGRLINYISFTAGVAAHTGLIGRYRCVICYSNPPILPLTAILASGLFGTRTVFTAYDVYPEIAYASGNIRKGSVVDRNMRRINHIFYKKVDLVIALTEEMRRFILRHRPGISGDRIKVIQNWAHEENEILPDPDGNVAEKDAEQESVFCVSYIGNMGICQDTETLLQAAKEMAGNRRVRFELTGHGNKKPAMEESVRTGHLENIHFNSYMTGTVLRVKLQQADCCVVSLTPGLKGMCSPSKYLTYLYAGKPIISVMDPDSCISREVVREKIGFAVPNGDTDAFIKAILWLQEHPEEAHAMGVRAGELYRRKYRYALAMEKYLEAIESLPDPQRGWRSGIRGDDRREGDGI